MPALLTPRQAARELGVSVRHLQDMARIGAIAFIDIGIGASVNRRFDPNDIEAFKTSRRTIEAPPTSPGVRAGRAKGSAAVVPFRTTYKDLNLKRRYPGPPSNLKSPRPTPPRRKD